MKALKILNTISNMGISPYGNCRNITIFTQDMEEIIEAIDELKELKKINTCIGCKWEGKSAALYPCMNCIRSVDTDHYEPKGAMR